MALGQYLYPFIVCIISLSWAGCDQKPSGVSTDEVSVEVDPVQQKLIDLTNRIKASPNDAIHYFARGQYYADHGLLSDAIEDFIQCRLLDSAYALCWRGLSQAYLDDGQSRLAVETLEDYLTINPNHDSARLQLSELQMVIERYAAAHMHLNTILKRDSDNARALLLKGLTYRYEGRDLEAVEYFQRAVQSDPELTDGYLLLGQTFEEAGNSMAIKYYQNALRIDPNNPEVKMALANYSWTKGDIDLAIEQFDALILQHPNFSRARFNRGLLYLEREDWVTAQSAFQNTIQLAPFFIDAHYYLGEALAEQGLYQEAFRAVERAHQLSPNDQRIKRTFMELQSQVEASKHQ